MRKVFLIFLLIIAILLLVGYTFFIKDIGAPIFAEDYECRIFLDKTVKISYYSGTDDEVVIPSYIEDYEVVAIGSGAFNSSTIKKITIPDTVTNIDTAAFANCPSLETVVLGDGVINIASGAFAMCETLEEVVLPDSVKSIGAGAFAACTSLKNINLPKNLEKIEAAAFAYCAALEDIQLPDKLQVIDDLAFTFCSLRSISIPDSVKSIGSGAFLGCIALESASIGAGVEEFGEITTPYLEALSDIINLAVETPWDNAEAYFFENGIQFGRIISVYESAQNNPDFSVPPFMFCPMTDSVTVSSANSNYFINDNAIYSTAPQTLIHCFARESAEYTVLDGTSEIGDFACIEMLLLQNLTLPDSVYYIGAGAFAASPIEELVLPESLTEIGPIAFAGCMNLKRVAIPAATRCISAGAFVDCSSIEAVYYSGNQKSWHNVSVSAGNDIIFDRLIFAAQE